MHCHSASELGNGAERLRPSERRRVQDDGEDSVANAVRFGCGHCSPEMFSAEAT